MGCQCFPHLKRQACRDKRFDNSWEPFQIGSVNGTITPGLPPGDARHEAILKLLEDDSETSDLVLQELRTSIDTEEMERLLAAAEGRARPLLEHAQWERRLPEKMDALRVASEKLDSFDQFAAFAWALAAVGQPDTRQREAVDLIGQWGDTLRIRVGLDRSPQKIWSEMVNLLAKETGLLGNTDHYNAIENSFIDSVVLTRRGIPISLATVYMLVAHEAEIAVHGVGFPGHFLARIGDIFFDPYHAGVQIERRELQAALDAHGYEERIEEFLAPLPYRYIAIRMVNNLISMDKRHAETPWQEVRDWLAHSVSQ